MEQFILPSGETTFDVMEFADATTSLGKDLVSALGLGYSYAGCTRGELRLRRGDHEPDLSFAFDLALRITEMYQRLETLSATQGGS